MSGLSTPRSGLILRGFLPQGNPSIGIPFCSSWPVVPKQKHKSNPIRPRNPTITRKELVIFPPLFFWTAIHETNEPLILPQCLEIWCIANHLRRNPQGDRLLKYVQCPTTLSDLLVYNACVE